VNIKRYTTTTAKKHVLSTRPHRVTRTTRKELYDNTNYKEIYDQIDSSMQTILVALANTPFERAAISIVNMFLRKLTFLFDKELKKQKK